MAKDIMTESLLDEYAETIAKETFKLMKGNNIKNELYKELSVKYVKHFIELLIYATLVEHKNNKKLTSDKAYEITHKNFTGVKHGLANAVSEGFEEAFKRFSNRYIEYYCTINPVPEPINKEPC